MLYPPSPPPSPILTVPAVFWGFLVYWSMIIWFVIAKMKLRMLSCHEHKSAVKVGVCVKRGFTCEVHHSIGRTIIKLYTYSGQRGQKPYPVQSLAHPHIGHNYKGVSPGSSLCSSCGCNPYSSLFTGCRCCW